MNRIINTMAAVLTALPLAAGAGETSREIAYDDLTWVPFGEGSPVMMAQLWGNMATGPSGFLLKMPAGFEVPMHTHSAGYRAVVISGEALHWDKGTERADAVAVGPGSYLEQPPGAFHYDANPGSQDMVALVIYDGPVDFVFPE